MDLQRKVFVVVAVVVLLSVVLLVDLLKMPLDVKFGLVDTQQLRLVRRRLDFTLHELLIDRIERCWCQLLGKGQVGLG